MALDPGARALDPPPAGLDLRPLGLGDLLDWSFRLYRNDFVVWLGIGAIVLVPEALIVTPLWPGQAALMGPNGPEKWAALQRAAMLAPVIVLAMGLAQAALASAVADRYLGRSLSAAVAYRRALRRLLPLVGVLVLVMLALGLVFGILAGAGFAAAGVPGVIMGTVLGLGAMVYLWLGWVMAPTVVVLEDGGAFRSLGRSWRLARGTRLRLFVLLLLFLLLGLTMKVTVGTLIGFVTRAELATSLGERLAQLLLLPVTQAAWVLAYLDCRVRKEGFDLEMMAAALAEPVAR